MAPGAQAAPAPPGETNPVLGWTAVAGGYVVMEAYAFLTWYDNDQQRSFFVTDEGWFARDSYAGGADKLGHGYSSYVITRTGAGLLRWAGLTRGEALATSAVLDTLFFTSIEVKDGMTANLGFSWGDVAANTAGALLAVAFELNPALDRALDLRLEYYPSREYLDAVDREGTLNAVEDYTGMTFGLWYHLGELPAVRSRPGLRWLRFVDVGVTYRARNYRPVPDEPRPTEREFGVGISVNAAELFNALAGRPGGTTATNWFFEYFTIPGTALTTR